MRICCGAVFIFLIASGFSFGQVPEGWDQWLTDGLKADDQAEYEGAEKLLGQTCNLSLAQQLGPERLTRACLALSSAYSVQGKWENAADVTRLLVQAQAQLADTPPERRAEALIRSASADMADGKDKTAKKSIQAAIDLAREMDPEPASAAFSEIAELYAADEPKGFGANLLDAALSTLMAQPKKDTVSYVTAATKVGRALGAFERWQDATKLLLPLVETAEKRMDTKTEHDELWDAYDAAFSTAIAAFKMLGNDRQADRVKELHGGWPLVLTLGPGRLFASTLAFKVDPEYPPAAERHRINGFVILSALVDLDGRAHDIQVVKGVPYGFSWTAVKAVRKWRFNPAISNGEPAASRVLIELHLRRM